jgi:hypothetical protein
MHSGLVVTIRYENDRSVFAMGRQSLCCYRPWLTSAVGRGR